MDITTGNTELTSSPWVNPGDSDSHEAALLLHWLTVSRMLLQPYARALASTVLTFPEPQGSFSISYSSLSLVLREQCIEREVYIGSRVNVFTHSPSLWNQPKRY